MVDKNTEISSEAGPALTIDTSGLRDWLRWEADAARAMDVVYATYKRAKAHSNRCAALWDAYWVCRVDWEIKVRHVRTNGGLLLIGGAA